MEIFHLPIVQPDKTVLQQPVIYQFTGDNRFLSNFYPCSVSLPAEGNLPEMDFRTVEHAYMAWKTLDYNLRVEMGGLKPSHAKKRTHEPGFPLRPDYNDKSRIAIVTHLAEQKFGDRNPELRDLLLQTKDALLIEGNTWHDDFFGFDLIKGYGQNHLGRIIMDVRSRLVM